MTARAAKELELAKESATAPTPAKRITIEEAIKKYLNTTGMLPHRTRLQHRRE